MKEKKPVTLAPADLDLIKSGTETDASPTEIAEDKEDSEGGVATVNWDDDNNSGGPGKHGKVDYKNDFADPGETKGENDLIRLKLHQAAAGITARIKYANTHLKLWQTATRIGEVLSETTEFDLAADRIVYIEGLKLTASGQPVEIEMQVKAAADTAYQPGDTVKVHVATPVIYLGGVAPGTDDREQNAILDALRDKKDKSVLQKLRVDDRLFTAVIKGKNTSGITLYYAVDVFSAIPTTSITKSGFIARSLDSDKQMKLALGVEGAQVIFSGHSNFGLGPNFMFNCTRTVDDYMNVSNYGVAGIILRTEDLSSVTNPMHDKEHGGPHFAIRATDIRGTVPNDWVDLTRAGNPTNFHQRRFPPNDASFPRIPAAGDVPAHHFTEESTVPAQDGEGGIIPEHTKRDYVTIVGSTGDAPTLRYGSLFMASCSSGRHFGLTFSRKPFIYTAEVSATLIDEKDFEDFKLANPYVTYLYLERLILGNSLPSTATFLNSVRHGKAHTSEYHYAVSQ